MPQTFYFSRTQSDAYIIPVGIIRSKCYLAFKGVRQVIGGAGYDEIRFSRCGQRYVLHPVPPVQPGTGFMLVLEPEYLDSGPRDTFTRTELSVTVLIFIYKT